MSIRAKILGSMLFVSILGMILGAVGFISARSLSVKAGEMSYFTSRSRDFTSILNAHYGWRNALVDSMITGHEFTGSLDSKTCSLGKWLNSDRGRVITEPNTRDLLARMTAPHDLIHHEAANLKRLLSAKDHDGATNLLVNVILPKCDEVINILLELNKNYSDMAYATESESARIAEMSATIIIVLIVIMLTVSVFLSLFTSGNISKPLVAISNFMTRASSTGDITLDPKFIENISASAKSKDEVGQTIKSCAEFVRRITEVSEILSAFADSDLTKDIDLLSNKDTMGSALHNLFESLNKVFSEMNTSAGEVFSGAEKVARIAANISDSSEQIASGAQSLAEGATKQAESIEDVSHSIDEISEKTKTNADMAEQAAQLTHNIINNAEKGSRQMGEMVTAVSDINEASKSISKIMETINGIANQTNLLALNAAIEAARAGEHGRGFSVVAEEVRKLAVQSEEAVKETSSIIDSSMEKAELGAKLAGEMASSLTEIVAGINESSKLITNIVKASEEQLKSITHINTNIRQVTNIVQQNSALAEENAAVSEESTAASQESTVAAGEMRVNAETLSKLISHFKLKDSNSAVKAIKAKAR